MSITGSYVNLQFVKFSHHYGSEYVSKVQSHYKAEKQITTQDSNVYIIQSVHQRCIDNWNK